MHVDIANPPATTAIRLFGSAVLLRSGATAQGERREGYSSHDHTRFVPDVKGRLLTIVGTFEGCQHGPPHNPVLVGELLD